MSKRSKKEAKSVKKKASVSGRIGAWVARNRFPLALVIITFVVFANSLANQYALDDEYYTASGNTQTPELIRKGFRGIPALMKNRTFQNYDGTGYSYRPLVAVSFAIEYQFFGQSPLVSHFISVSLYALTLVVLFALLRKWFVTQGNWFSFFICLIFLVHPLHTEVVDNIKCRDELLSMLGAIASLYFAWRHYETGKWKYLIFYPLCFWIGILSKHTILLYYVLFPMAFWFFSNANWKRILLYLVPLFATTLFTVLILKSIPEGQRHYLMQENPFVDGHYGFIHKFGTAMYVLGRYLYLQFIPYPLVYYYGYRYIPIVGLGNAIALISLVVHLGLGILGLIGLRKKTIWGFGILFYLGCMVPYSNLLQPAPGLMAERFAYDASLGFCIVLVWAVFHFFKTNPVSFSWTENKVLRNVIVLIALAFAVRTVIRNTAWENKFTLYDNDMAYLGESAKANMLYAQLHSAETMGNKNLNDDERMQRYNDTKAHFKKALSIFPGYATAWSNLGSNYYFLKQYDSAQYCFYRSLKLDTGNAKTYMSLGMNYAGKAVFDSANQSFLHAIRLDSTYVEAYEYLAKLVARRGHPDRAIRLLALAAQKNPTSTSPFYVMGDIYIKEKNNRDSGAICYEAGISRNPHDTYHLQQLVAYYTMKQNFNKVNMYRTMLQNEMDKQKPVVPDEE